MKELTSYNRVAGYLNKVFDLLNLVLQYLQANTDESHSVSASEISGYLEEILGINADRRSIYSDIDEKLLYPDDTIQELSDYLDKIRNLY